MRGGGKRIMRVINSKSYRVHGCISWVKGSNPYSEFPFSHWDFYFFIWITCLLIYLFVHLLIVLNERLVSVGFNLLVGISNHILIHIYSVLLVNFIFLILLMMPHFLPEDQWKEIILQKTLNEYLQNIKIEHAKRVEECLQSLDLNQIINGYSIYCRQRLID